MPTIRLAAEDAIELAELLQFIKDWITADDQAKASFARFVGTPATTQPTSAPTSTGSPSCSAATTESTYSHESMLSVANEDGPVGGLPTRTGLIGWHAANAVRVSRGRCEPSVPTVRRNLIGTPTWGATTKSAHDRIRARLIDVGPTSLAMGTCRWP
jgi:hypothetical protein